MKDLRRTVHCARPRGYGEGSSSILFLPGQASLRHKVGAAYLFDDRAGEGGEEGEGFEVPPSGLEPTLKPLRRTRRLTPTRRRFTATARWASMTAACSNTSGEAAARGRRSGTFSACS